jgi:hypothetical protein
MAMGSGYMVSQAMYVTAKLGIADLLADGPKSSSEMAAKIAADASALYRLLRALAARGVFREHSNGRFELTPLSECLQTNSPTSLRATIIMWNEEQYRAWGELLHTVKTGETAFEHMFGATWDKHYVRGEPERAKMFNAAMTRLTAQTGAAVIQAYDFSALDTLIDIGGGHGILLTLILKAFPKARGIVFDIDSVISGTKTHIETEGLSNRCEAISGDFFAVVPSGGDAYILSQVLHDWNDDDAIRILTNCHHSMSKHAKLLVMETVIQPGTDSSLATLSDLHMMAVTGGRERTEAEYANLLSGAGLRLNKIVSTQSLVNVIEASKA